MLESDLENSASGDETDDNYDEEEDYTNEQSAEDLASSEIKDNLNFIEKNGWKKNSKRKGRTPKINIFQWPGL